MSEYWRDSWRIKESLRYLPWGIAAAERFATATNERAVRVLAANLTLSYSLVLLGAGRFAEAEAGLQQGLALTRAAEDASVEQSLLASLTGLAKAREGLADLEIDAPLSDKRAVGSALGAMESSTESPHAMRGVLCYAQRLLLSDAADQLLTTYMTQALRHNNQQEHDTIYTQRALLRRARVIGIDDAWIEFRAGLLVPPHPRRLNPRLRLFARPGPHPRQKMLSNGLRAPRREARWRTKSASCSLARRALPRHAERQRASQPSQHQPALHRAPAKPPRVPWKRSSPSCFLAGQAPGSHAANRHLRPRNQPGAAWRSN
jgi:hypothetical protein